MLTYWIRTQVNYPSGLCLSKNLLNLLLSSFSRIFKMEVKWEACNFLRTCLSPGSAEWHNFGKIHCVWKCGGLEWRFLALISVLSQLLCFNLHCYSFFHHCCSLSLSFLCPSSPPHQHWGQILLRVSCGWITVAFEHFKEHPDDSRRSLKCFFAASISFNTIFKLLHHHQVNSVCTLGWACLSLPA